MTPLWLRTRPIAHRGLHSGDGRIPENSCAAFQRSVEAKYPLELDVHLSADGKLLVFHDEELERMCGAKRLISQLTSVTRKRYRLLGSAETIPLLEEVVELVDGRVPLLIELKSGRKVKEIQRALIPLLRSYRGEVAVQSFDPYALQMLAAAMPQIPRGQLSGSFKGEKMRFSQKKQLQHYRFNFISKPHFIAHEAEDLLTNLTVRRLRAQGMPVLGWTVRSQSAYARIMPYCDSVIFEGFRP